MTNDNQQDKNCCYLNNAGQARLSAAVQLTGIRSITTTMPGSPSNDDDDRCRALFAQLIHAPTSDIAIVPSTAFAMTMAARNVERMYPEGGRILVLEDQFPSAVYPWQALCRDSNSSDINQKKKWSLDIVRYPAAYSGQRNWVHVRASSSSPRNWTEAIVSHLQQQPSNSSDPIRVVCIPPLHWSGIGGTVIDLPRISQICQQHNIVLVVDATQAIGVAPFDIRPLLPALAMVACSSHKWLRGPPGTCLVYINPGLHETWEPLDQHHRSRCPSSTSNCTPSPDSRNQMNIPDGYSELFVTDARKFNAGGTPNPLLLPMLRAALEEVTPLMNVQMQLKELVQPLIEWAREHGIPLSTDMAHDDDDGDDSPFYHIIHLALDDDKTLEQKEQLWRDLIAHYSVYTAIRCGGLRISPYLDNTKEDIQQLINGLKELLSRFT